MTQKMTATLTGKKGGGVLRALGDLCILALLLIAAGAGGYFWGLHQQLAPVEKVGPGTPGAAQATGMSPMPAPKSEPAAAKKDSNETSPTKTSKPSESASSAEASSGKTSAKKYWISSSGTDYIGYSITVKVNDNPVDNFFGPGKNVDITRLVKTGDNTVALEAKQMGEQYNKHIGDAKSVLTVQVVSGPHLTDTFKKSDVVLSYKRTAVDTEDSTDTFHFTKE